MGNDPTPPKTRDEATPGRPVRPSPPRSTLAWSLCAVLLLGTSGAVRDWQDRRFGVHLTQAVHPPFPLDQLPTTLGDGQWRIHGGGDRMIDAKTLQIAGASSYLLRSYVEPSTGVLLSVLVLFGRADRIFGHTPDICFPANGYVPYGARTDRPIPIASGTAVFRSAAYSNPKIGPSSLQEIYHGFRYRGRWVPDASSLQKEFRSDPRMFKVQTQRRVTPTERRDGNDPAERFLALLLDAIEETLAKQGGAGAAPKSSGPTPLSPGPPTKREVVPSG